MTTTQLIEDALAARGLRIPDAPPAVARYRPWVLDGGLLFVSGQVSRGAEGAMTGTLGKDASLEDGVAAARQCGLNLLGQIKDACAGDLGRIERVVRLSGFVKVTPGFTAIPQVMDGCSELMLDAFGAAGEHARSAIGVAELPGGCLVEVEAIVRLRGAGGHQ